MNLKNKMLVAAACAAVFGAALYGDIAKAAVKGDQNPALLNGAVVCQVYDAGTPASVPNMANANAIALANEGSTKVYIGATTAVSNTTGFPIAAGTQLGIDVVQVTQGQSPGPFDGGVIAMAPSLYCVTAPGTATSDLRYIRVK